MKEYITGRQIVFLMVLFCFGSSIVVGVSVNKDVAQDSWLSLIFSCIFTIPFLLVFARITELYPEKNIYEIINIIFGKFIGKFLSIIFMIDVIYLCSIVLRNFSEFVEITGLPETPQLPIMICLIMVIAYLSVSGIRVLGRWGPIILTILCITIVATLGLSVPIMDTGNLKPILNHTPIEMLNSSFKIFMLPFSELIVFLGLADCFKKTENKKKIFVGGIILSSLLLLLIMLRNIMVLGIPMMQDTYFSSYQTARILHLGEFFTRIEGIITINFLLTGISKMAIFLIVISKGFASIFDEPDFKRYIFITALIVLGICPFLFENITDMFDFAPIFGKITVPLHIILPITILILAEIKKFIKKQNSTNLVKS